MAQIKIKYSVVYNWSNGWRPRWIDAIVIYPKGEKESYCRDIPTIFKDSGWRKSYEHQGGTTYTDETPPDILIKALDKIDPRCPDDDEKYPTDEGELVFEINYKK